MKKIILSIICLSLYSFGFTQNDSTYTFKITNDIQATSVKSQGSTGTCWSFSTASFLESELIRINKGNVDLSEMFVVRNVYKAKAQNYVQRQGKANFSQGSLAHDLLNAVYEHGAIPELAYKGKSYDGEKHQHSELFSLLKAFVDAVIKNRSGQLNTQWIEAFDGVLNAYLGSAPETFTFQGQSYTPKSFAKDFMQFERENYIHLTSFNNLPLYQSNILNIPDNFSNGQFYNLPLNEFQEVLDYALSQGFTAVWDCDVSEKSFNRKEGVAIIPEKPWSEKSQLERKNTGVLVETELEVSEEFRMNEFLNQKTTDDHLMHITGTAKDQYDTPYYIVKNSWGDKIGKSGYLYASESYFQLKSISYTLHKNAIPKNIRKKLGI